MREVKVTDLKEGMILGAPVRDAKGVQLFAEGVSLDRKKIELLLKRNIPSVMILDEEPRIKKTAAEPLTGKLVFTGDMKIDGDVEEGAEIEIDGTLEINGKIYAAKVIVKNGNLIVEGVEGEGRTQIYVDGMLKTKYILDSSVHTKRDVVAESLISRSKVDSEGNVIVHSDDRNAIIMRAEISSSGKVVVDNLGMKGESGTTIVRIRDSEKRKLFEQALYFEKLIKESQAQAARLKKVVDIVKTIGQNIKSLPEEKQKYLVSNAKEYLKLVKQAEEAEALLQKTYKQIEQLKKEKRYFVRVLNNIFPGVVIEIDGQRLEVREKAKNVAFYKKGIIIMENIKERG